MTTSELQFTAEDHEKAFNEVCSLLEVLVDAIDKSVGKATPSLAIAAGRKMAGQLPVNLSEPTPKEALAELVRIFNERQIEIQGEMQEKGAVITINNCPIGEVCRQRNIALNGSVCQMFHYYLSGIMAELASRPTRPKTLAAGETCCISFALAGAPR